MKGLKSYFHPGFLRASSEISAYPQRTLVGNENLNQILKIVAEEGFFENYATSSSQTWAVYNNCF